MERIKIMQQFIKIRVKCNQGYVIHISKNIYKMKKWRKDF